MSTGFGEGSAGAARPDGPPSATPLHFQHAAAKRDEVIADGVDRILDAAQREGETGSNVLWFHHGDTGS